QLRRRRSPASQGRSPVGDLRDRKPTPFELLEQRDDEHRALAALSHLPPRQKEVLYLSACEAMSVSEIGEVLGITSNAVKASLCVARASMGELLRDLFEASARSQTTRGTQP